VHDVDDIVSGTSLRHVKAKVLLVDIESILSNTTTITTSVNEPPAAISVHCDGDTNDPSDDLSSSRAPQTNETTTTKRSTVNQVINLIHHQQLMHLGNEPDRSPLPSGTLPSHIATEQVSGKIQSTAGTYPRPGSSRVGDPGKASIHPALGSVAIVHPLACGNPSMCAGERSKISMQEACISSICPGNPGAY
jgi:hypothetical protein